MGTLDSGKAIYDFTHSHNNYDFPGAIQFMESPIDITGSISDSIIDGATREENGILYVYLIGHTGKLWKLQVNDIATSNPSFFSSAMISQLTTATSFHQGGSLNIFGSPEKILIGHDDGVTVIGLDGSNEQLLDGDWVQDVPHQAVIQFNIIYYTNGNSLISFGRDMKVIRSSLIDSVADDQIFKDVEIDKTGQNILAISSNIPNSDMTVYDEDVISGYVALSYVYRLNPKTNEFISINPSPGFNQTALLTEGNKEYVFGFDVAGGGMTEITDNFRRLISGVGSLIPCKAPCPNAVGASSSIIGFVVPEATIPYSGGPGERLGCSVFFSGPLDLDSPDPAYFREAHFVSSLAGGDIIKIPCQITLTNQIVNGGISGYKLSPISRSPTLGRILISTVEYNQVGYAYKLYVLKVATSFAYPFAQGVYETQLQMGDENESTVVSDFTPTSVRAYCYPIMGYETFMVSLVGADGQPIDGDSQVFTATGFPGNAAQGAIKLNAEPADGVTITIDDGSGPVVFEFDSNSSVTGSNVPVILQGNPFATAAVLAAAIDANLTITATPNATGTVYLVNEAVGVAGNEAIATTDPTNVLFVGMVAGLDAIVTPNISAGDTILTYTPSGAKTFAIGIRVTNISPYMTPIIYKVEIDYT
jgi:hypothetical protein